MNGNMSRDPQLPRFDTLDPNELLQHFNNNRSQLFVVIGAALVAITAFSSMFTVQPDEKAVLLRFGRYVSTAQPGLNFKFPFGVDEKIKITTRVEQENFGIANPINGSGSGINQTTSISQPRSANEESLMLTGDLKVAEVRWSVQYQIVNPRQFVFSSPNPQKVIRDISVGTMRQVVGDKGVYEVLTVGRERIAAEAQELTQKVLNEKYNMGVEIVAVNLQSVSPPAPVAPSFNDVNAAIQDKDQAVNRAESDYNRVIPEARGKGEQQLLAAEGYAVEILNHAKGDAERLSKVIAQYEKAPEVTKARLYLEMAEGLMERMASVTIIDPSLKGVLPIFNESNQHSKAVLAENMNKQTSESPQHGQPQKGRQ